MSEIPVWGRADWIALAPVPPECVPDGGDGNGGGEGGGGGGGGGICTAQACPPGQIRDPWSCQCVPRGGGGQRCTLQACPPGQIRDPQTCQCVPRGGISGNERRVYPYNSAVCVAGTQGDLPLPGPVVVYSPGSVNIGSTACP